MEKLKKEFRCRSCNSDQLTPILSLGDVPLANALLTREELGQSEAKYPLDLVFCRSCNLVQITETVPPEILFSNYLYFSSFSDAVMENARQIAEKMIVRRKLGPEHLVVEIASNDGYLLANYIKAGVPCIGIEPAKNIAKYAIEKGIPTLNRFFGTELAAEMKAQGEAADVIHANNVIAHVAGLHDVIEGIATLLKPDGVAIIENHYVKDLIDQVEFDVIYHEHLCYYSLTSFINLFKQHGLKAVDVERIPMQGGSLRMYFQREDGPRSFEAEGRKNIDSLLASEKEWGMDSETFYKNFGQKVNDLRQSLRDLLAEIKASHKRISVYGASAKSTTLLNYFGIGQETIDYVVDRSTVKQNHYTPGTHLLINSPDQLLQDRPEFVLLLAWNFAEEVLKQQDAYRKQGGKFIIPIPKIQIV